MPFRNRQERNAYMRAWKARNAKKVKEYNDLWRARNPKYSKEYHNAHDEPSKKAPKDPKVPKVPKRKRHVNIRDGVLKRKYGIDLEEYNRMFAEQEGKCAICGIHQSEYKKALSVDHCHETDHVRGLLCLKCNAAIGLLNDDIENLKCAMLYLNANAKRLSSSKT